MARPRRRAQKKKRWEQVKLIASGVAAVIGGVTAAVGLPGNLEKAFGRSESKQTKLELAQKRSALAVAAPRLDVSYLLLFPGLVDATPGVKRPTSRQAITLLSIPTIPTPVLKDEWASTDSCRLGKYPQLSVAFLVIQNRGTRDASEIQVSGDWLRLRGHVRIHESIVGGDDYVAKLRARARSSAAATITVPRVLPPGVSVRVPIWVSANRRDDAQQWCVTSKAALLPTTVRFVDPVLGDARTVAVRRLASPEIIDDGVVGRG